MFPVGPDIKRFDIPLNSKIYIKNCYHIEIFSLFVIKSNYFE